MIGKSTKNQNGLVVTETSSVYKNPIAGVPGDYYITVDIMLTTKMRNNEE